LNSTGRSSYRGLYALALLCCCAVTLNASERLYGIENGYIVYKNENTQQNLQKISTTKTLQFSSWGATELVKENGTITTKYGVFPLHIMYKREAGNVYTVDFDKSVILRQPYSHNATNIQPTRFSAPENVPASKQENILGYPCDVWETSSGKFWNYRGVMLKYEIRNNKSFVRSEAIQADFNRSTVHPELRLPDFPVTSEREPAQPEEDTLLQDKSVGELIEGAEVINDLLN
jgi:hypothetical protein